MTVVRHLILPVAALLASGCGAPPSDLTDDGRIRVAYWEKWTGFELEAMEAVVNDFNTTQSRIKVELLSVSDIANKLMLATSGGNPPDLAGLWAHHVPVYAEKNALLPLDRRLADSGLVSADYIPVLWDLCRHRGHQWALPLTPATLALHWNKEHFREAGLDPDRPPQSLAELDAMAERLTIVTVQRDGQTHRVRFSELTPDERNRRAFVLERLGFSPNEPGWWNSMWGYWFGGRLWDGDRRITPATSENVEALRWFGGYPAKYGLRNMQLFGSSLGNFSSPQNAFLSGRVSMVLQGVWMYNFISKFAPSLEWGVAPFPSADPERWPAVTLAECDVLVIPRGARHPDEAMVFAQYVQRPEVMERLCLAQRKFPPRLAVSEAFYARHPNPFVRIFVELARSPNARTAPRLTMWNEYDEELRNAYDRVFLGLAPPEEALEETQRRVQWKFDRMLRRWDWVGAKRLEEWRQ